jgi:tRNA(fMet)-specific endonuclease VapC
VTYLLDTNAVVALLRDRPSEVRDRFRQVVNSGATVAVSSVVLFELWFGVARSQRVAENAERLRVFLTGRVIVLGFDEEDGKVAGELRADLEMAGTKIGAYDLLIASQALRRGAILVTANVGEFARVRSLTWEDWSQPNSV